MSEFHSRFGGLWIDHVDPARVQAKLDAIGSPRMRLLMSNFIRDGFVILENAVSHRAIDAYLAEYERAADEPGALEIEVPMEGGRQAFGRGKAMTTQALHRDTAYVVVNMEPMKLSRRVGSR